jgi:hypothetical protein
MLAEIYGWFTEGFDLADLNARRRPAIKPSPSDDPVTKTFAISSFVVSAAGGEPVHIMRSTRCLACLSGAPVPAGTIPVSCG